MGLFNKNKKLDDQTMKHGAPLIVEDNPSSPVAEQFRTVRTNIKFSIIGDNNKTISITSADPSEGKSVFSSNLAVTFAQQGEKTILIDADLRRPTVHKTFTVSNQEGLSNYLSGNISLDEVITKTDIDNLEVITSGPIPPNPAELIGSLNFKNMLNDLNEKYDWILIDTPPVNAATDASLIAADCYGTILVVPQSIANKIDVNNAVEQLKKVNAKILGTVMNRVNIKESSGYGGYYGGYYGAEKND
ncbi:CpsD/CapB family tyrosine-protein kinase [Fructilactobacillus frigidiflavus]|uniref:CpsD/CapB family tyrosine-protein kinase n=1 Tax=Fructilactobacillus frigidiflavus TaxID=3242688 RepID=UPI003756CA25